MQSIKGIWQISLNKIMFGGNMHSKNLCICQKDKKLHLSPVVPLLTWINFNPSMDM